ncbi:glycosyltransferase family 4 protein [Candidatus Daviesbacteria bacterium]|nr:glycosyltransferase family 4 protein [Candidatus Daviesbacteria bacterium]
MKVLQLTVHLFPNIGGVETHLNDLFIALIKRGWKVVVLTYQPLSTNTDWKVVEKNGELTILRMPWLRGFFEKLVHHPVIEFIYLVPGLFLITPFLIIFYRPNVIHAHGISAAVSAVCWGNIFRIRTVVSLHSLYSFPKSGMYHDFVQFLLKKSDFVLSLSKKSNQEVRLLGIDDKKTAVFTYWINLQRFKYTPDAKKKLGWERKFIVLFVGRLIEEKGIKPLVEAAYLWNNKINLVVIGSGSMEEYVLKKAKERTNIFFIGKVNQNDLQIYYSAADCVIVPSVSEEGFGRVIIESLSCNTPVIASDRGATREAMDETVGEFIDVSPENIKQAVEQLYKNPQKLKDYAKRTRKFVERRYSENNVQTITEAYKG